VDVEVDNGERLVARTRKGWRPNYEGADRPARKLAKSIELDPEPEDSGEISEERRSILAKIDELMEKLASEEAKTPPDTAKKRRIKKLDMAIDDWIKGSSIKQTEKARKKKWVVPLNEIWRIACEACRTQGIKEPKIYLDCKDATKTEEDFLEMIEITLGRGAWRTLQKHVCSFLQVHR
jgi:hypothetical protein